MNLNELTERFKELIKNVTNDEIGKTKDIEDLRKIIAVYKNLEDSLDRIKKFIEEQEKDEKEQEK